MENRRKDRVGENMFLHIGDNFMLMKKDIIAILDWETDRERNANLVFYKNWKEQKKPIFACREESQIKSLVLTDQQIYLSAISCQTLKKRANQMQFSWE